MIAPRSEPRGPDCPSDLGLSQLMVGEMPARDAKLREHVDGCARCRARLTRLESAQLPPLRLGADLPAPAAAVGRDVPRRRRRSVWAVAGIAAAAAAAMVVWVRGTGDPDGGVRIKGELALGVIVKRASGATDRLVAGAAVAPGDALRFELGHPGPGHAAVVGIDSRRVVSVYVPQGDTALAVVAGAGTTLLPGAIALDDAPGGERLFALLCEQPLPVERIRRQAEQRLSAAGRPEDVATLGLPCREARFLVTKAPRK